IPELHPMFDCGSASVSIHQLLDKASLVTIDLGINLEKALIDSNAKKVGTPTDS
ncbi:hypothetical protein STEG23_037210, partial [Scotinomys teguina]